MGFASYLEDIINKQTRDLRSIEKEIQKENDSDQIRESLVRFHKICQSHLVELQNLVELATDPELDVALQITNLKEELRITQKDFRNVESDRDNLKQEIKRLNKNILDLNRLNAAQKKAHKKTEKEKRKIEERYNELIANDTDAFSKTLENYLPSPKK